MAVIREICEADASDFLWLCKTLDRESTMMMYEPGERRTTVETMRKHIRVIREVDNSAIFVVEAEARLAGYIEAAGGCFNRNKHSATIIIGILQEFSGRGLGTRLFNHMEAWAWRQGLHRLELTVMTHNTAAIALYKKMGFVEEGVRRCSLQVDGEWIDEFTMAKILE